MWTWSKEDHLAVWDATEPAAALRLHLRHEHGISRKRGGLSAMTPEDLRTLHHQIHDESENH